MPLDENGAVSVVRLAELCAAISLFTDLGTGQPAEHAMRSCLVSMRLADALGLQPDQRAALYYTALLRFVGCTAGSHEAAAVAGGDELRFFAAMAPVAMGSKPEQARRLITAVAPDASPIHRARRVAAALADPRGGERVLGAHCEVAQRLAHRIHLPEGVAAALGAAYARWDGNGVPAGLAGEAIPLVMRTAIVARDAVLLSRQAPDEAADALRHRRAKAYDPTVVDAALAIGIAELTREQEGDIWEETISAEPEPQRRVSGEGLRDVLIAFADFADLKMPELVGHSRGVERLASAAGDLLQLSGERRHRLEYAALLHDLGRVAVAGGIWSQPGPLTAGQWEQVRLHAYYSERILSRSAALAPVARIAGSHHERLDGSGYHRGSTGGVLGPEERLLAVADAYQAMTQPRPHRSVRPPAAIAEELVRLVEAGLLGGKEVDAVLAATGDRSRAAMVERPAQLTEREVDVLRALARGRTNRAIAELLGISAKTVGTHVEHIYAKAGVSTRAAAAVFAMEHDLLD